MRALVYLTFLFVLLFSNAAKAQCNFNESEYIEALSDITQVKRIEVDIKKARKWAINSFKILSEDDPIKQKHKKRFKAEIRVFYEFGQCTLDAKLRQNGDHKDHIKRWYGQTISSLDVNLSKGNIGTATKFKLLLPSTRNSYAEIFGTMLLSELGILAPRTALIEVSVNGYPYSYLFQEKVAKELLERNSRREGPVLEGDEGLLWGYKDFDTMALNRVSLSRLENDKWALKGPSSFAASLNAFLKLQNTYLSFNTVHPQHSTFSDPNSGKDGSIFPFYNFAVFAMDGLHALKGHNRKFYYDAMSGLFEPVYYDGNLSFKNADLKHWHQKYEPVISMVSHAQIDEFKDAIERIKSDPDFAKRYSILSGLAEDKARGQVKDMADNLMARVEMLQKEKQKDTALPKASFDFDEQFKTFLNTSKKRGFDQMVYEIDKGSEENTYALKCIAGAGCQSIELGADAIIDIMTNNEIDEERAVIISSASDFVSEPSVKTISSEIGEIVHSPSAAVKVFADSKRIVLEQKEVDDWFLISNADVKDWTVEMIGLNDPSIKSSQEQRFNQFGLTGCLTFRSVSFDGAKIISSNGNCEDGVNIIEGSGYVKNIKVINAFADAVDVDFSVLEIGEINVNNAGNDCADFSYGTYKIDRLDVKHCGDKGISLGENSTFDLNVGVVDGAAIGMSSKDYSQLHVNKFTGNSIKVCAEAFKKKQEFGGARLMAEEFYCNGELNQDERSTISIKAGGS